MRNLIIILSFMPVFSSCSEANPNPKGTNDSQLADSLHFDTYVVTFIRELTDSVFSPVTGNMEEFLDMDLDSEDTVALIPGFYFQESQETADRIIDTLHKNLLEKGYLLLKVKQGFGGQLHSDKLAVFKTSDKFEILRLFQTNGINHDLNTREVIARLREFDSELDLDLIGAGGDWCEFTIGKNPTNWNDLSNRIYSFCPDVVDQGTQTVELLESEIKQTGTLYFWWD
ncbi:MAG: DUF4253 domain-containing protein [Pedobacter sp.]|nr:MAG: DUF4253 domain-containing protein [Pedobacter sp.]